MNKPQFTAQQFIEAIPGTGGVISLIAKKIPCTWHTAARYIANFPTIQQAYNDEVESILDMAEAQLFNAVKGGDFPAIKYLLSTKGKKRGYYEKQEHDVGGKDGQPITFRIVRDDDGIQDTSPDQVSPETE